LLGRDDDKAQQLIERAKQLGLSISEDAYAEALLAEKTEEAIEHLKSAVRLYAYNPGARASLELLLLLLGRLPEAREELVEHKALFPDDVRVHVLFAMVLALERDLAGANEHLDQLQGKLDPGELASYRALVRLFSEFRNPANPPHPVLGLPDLMPHLKAAAPQLGQLWHFLVNAGPQNPPAAGQRFLQAFPPLGPRLRFVIMTMLQRLGLAAAKNPIGVEAIRALGEVARVHPEGTILYWHALALLVTGHPKEAEEAALEAAKRPALFPVRRAAMRVAALSRISLCYISERTAQPVLFAKALGLMVSPLGQGSLLAIYGLVPERINDPNLVPMRRAFNNLRDELVRGPFVAFDTQVAIGLAYLTQDYDQVRVLLDDWERQAPDDIQPLIWRARTELHMGSYRQALEAAAKVLKTKPDDPEMLLIKEAATKAILEQGDFFRRAKPAKPPR
jgi:tetratricopeptide (TPR) repeat protein